MESEIQADNRESVQEISRFLWKPKFKLTIAKVFKKFLAFYGIRNSSWQSLKCSRNFSLFMETEIQAGNR